MKKIVLVLVILMLAAAPAFAGWNFNFFGSNDKQDKNRGHHRRVVPIERPEPNPPVTNVPEPATILLVGLGLVATGLAKKKLR